MKIKLRTKGQSSCAFCAFFILFSFTVLIPVVYSQSNIDTILSSTEAFFKALRSKDYAKTWSTLSSRSKETIISDIQNEPQASSKYSVDQIRKDLESGGPIARSYWGAFLRSFNPNMVLEDSKWEMGPIRPDSAEVVITYKKSRDPARIQMFKENGSWKIGLVETFWTRKK